MSNLHVNKVWGGGMVVYTVDGEQKSLQADGAALKALLSLEADRAALVEACEAFEAARTSPQLHDALVLAQAALAKARGES